ncbi:MAG: AMP-dependent synthetase/ligase [Hyphomicrobiaceae bacterium]
MSEAQTSRPLDADSDTVPKLLLRNAKRFADRPASRLKDLGIWQTHTWAQVRDEVRTLAIGLHSLGVERGHTVAIIGDNLPRLYWTFTAVQSLGGVPVPVYQDSVADEMAYVLEHAGVSIAVVENQEQVDKILSISEQVPSLKQVVYSDPRGLVKYDHTHLHSFADLQKLGAEQLQSNTQLDDWWLGEINATSGADTAVMLYTSGTTGRPKGVILSGENLVRTAANANRFDKLVETDEIIAYLPMAWVGDHIFSYAQSFEAGFCVACPESPATAVADRREIGPTFFFAPPRLFEAQLTDIQVRMQDAGWFKRMMFRNCLAVAKRCGEKILEGRSVNPYDRLMYFFGNLFVYGPLRNQLGFSKLRVGYTAGEAIGPEIFSFYRSLGINLKQLYGQTEASVYVTMQPDGEIYPDTVGRPAPEVEIEIADNGEVMFRSPGVFQEYYKNPEGTADTKTPDGWVHSGDAGFIDSRGHLVIIDRAKDVGKLNDGSLFAPKYIENKLKFFPEIGEAVTFGHGRDFVSAMINIDMNSVSSWAERNNIVYASYQELASHPDVYEMIRKRIEAMNSDLSKEERMKGSQIKRFLVLHKELDADDGELTRTLKIRRAFVADRYETLINALYDGSSRGQVSTEMTFEDGRKGIVEGDVRIMEVDAAAAAPVQEAAE